MSAVLRSNVRLARTDAGWWEVRWREAEGTRRQSLRTQSEQEAQRKLVDFLQAASTAGKPAGYTVADAWALRQKEGLRTVADPERLRYAWAALLPFFGDMGVSQVNQAGVHDYTAQRVEDGRALSTIRRELSELVTTLNAMVAARRVNPMDLAKLTLPEEHNTRPNYLSDQQRDALLAQAAARRQGEAPTRLELFIHIGLETGQRKRAIERLEWNQVDFAARMVHFRKEGERITKKRKPSVPMSAALQLVLQAEYARRTTRWVLREPSCQRHYFDSAVARAQLQGITPHSLRHTFVSQLLMRGKPVYSVAQLAGMTVAMIERTYGHLTPEHLRSILDRS